MSIDIEEVLRRDAAEVERSIASRRIPPSPLATVVPPVRRGWLLATGALVVAATVAVVVVAARDPKQSIEPVAPIETAADTVAPTASADGIATTSATPPPATAPPATAAPTTADLTTTTSVGSFTGVSLESLKFSGGPVAAGVVPAGYRPVLVQETHTDPPSTNPSVAAADLASQGWSATFIRRPTGDQQASSIFIMIENISNNDPYWGYPGTLGAPEVTMGAFTGKIDGSTPSNPWFVAPLNATQHVVISGTTTVADIQTVAEGLQLRAGGVGADATKLPDGYEQVDEGSRARPDSVADWSVRYVREQLSNSLITVRGVSEPREPALMNLLGPGAARIVDINGYEGVLSPRGLYFDVSPVFQVQVTRDSFTGDSAATDEDLIAFASSVVGISAEQFAELKESAAEHPLTPTDMPCPFYIHGDQPRSEDPAASVVHDYLSVSPGSTITVDLTATQPLGAVTFGLESIGFANEPGRDFPAVVDVSGVVVGMLDSLAGNATVELTWDGTVDGVPVPSGYYSITIGAEPADPNNPVGCSASPSGGGAVGALFKVP